MVGKSVLLEMLGSKPVDDMTRRAAMQTYETGRETGYGLFRDVSRGGLYLTDLIGGNERSVDLYTPVNNAWEHFLYDRGCAVEPVLYAHFHPNGNVTPSRADIATHANFSKPSSNAWELIGTFNDSNAPHSIDILLFQARRYRVQDEILFEAVRRSQERLALLYSFVERCVPIEPEENWVSKEARVPFIKRCYHKDFARELERTGHFRALGLTIFVGVGAGIC